MKIHEVPKLVAQELHQQRGQLVSAAAIEFSKLTFNEFAAGLKRLVPNLVGVGVLALYIDLTRIETDDFIKRVLGLDMLQSSTPLVQLPWGGAPLIF